jgi:hypothetical protein
VKENAMLSRKFWIAALGLGLLIPAGGSAWEEGSGRKQWDEHTARMLAQGWRPVAAGVFERQGGGNRVEHIAYGREGLDWAIGRLKGQLDTLHQEYGNHPSPDLARVIDELSVKIAGAERELRNMPSGLSYVAAAVTAQSCNICYGATADAFPLTGVQGTKAIAEGKFNSDCGFVGETYAYAYAKATLNGTTTVVIQSDPDSGSSILSNAVASVNGGPPCSSSANSYAQSTALGISYLTSDINDVPNNILNCPVPPTPFTVTINGPSYEIFFGAGCRTRTWTSTVSGGTSSFSYQWKKNGTAISGATSSSYSMSVCASQSPGFTLGLTVTDSSVPPQTATDTHEVTIEVEPTCGQYAC